MSYASQLGYSAAGRYCPSIADAEEAVTLLPVCLHGIGRCDLVTFRAEAAAVALIENGYVSGKDRWSVKPGFRAMFTVGRYAPHDETVYIYRDGVGPALACGTDGRLAHGDDPILH